MLTCFLSVFLLIALFDVQEFHHGFHVQLIHISFTAHSHMSVYIYVQYM